MNVLTYFEMRLEEYSKNKPAKAARYHTGLTHDGFKGTMRRLSGQTEQIKA